MSTPINNIKTPPVTPPTDTSVENLNSGLAAVQTLLQTSQAMLLNATATLVEGMKPRDSKHSPTSEVQATMKAAPAGDGTLTQAQLITQAYAYIAQIDNLYHAVDSGTLPLLALDGEVLEPSIFKNAPAPYSGPYNANSTAPYQGLIDIEKKITDPDVKSLIDQVVKELTAPSGGGSPPQAAVWRAWWNNHTDIGTSMTNWLSDKGNDDALDSELSRPEDKMNLIQILMDLTQKSNISVQGKSLDTLFWGLNGVISETVAAFFMMKDGNWSDAQKDINTFLAFAPPADPTNLPNYSKFIQGLKDVADTKKTTAWPYSFISAENLFNDGFAFIDAWAEFRTASPIVDPNHMTYGNS